VLIGVSSRKCESPFALKISFRRGRNRLRMSRNFFLNGERIAGELAFEEFNKRLKLLLKS
jgi:hypothetical protein